MVQMVTEYRYHVYVDRNDGRGMELAVQHDSYEKARKEANFLAGKGYEVEIKSNVKDAE